MGVTIIGGERGAGKTTFLCAQTAALAVRGWSVGGIAAPAVFESGRRVGYDLLDLRDHTTRRLARLAADGPADVGPYRFDEEAVAAGNAAIVAAVRDGLDLIAIDEIGPWELRGGGWAPGLKTALRELQPVQELLLVVRPAVIGSLPACFPLGRWAAARRVVPPWPDSLDLAR